MVFQKNYWTEYPNHKVFDDFKNKSSDEMWALFCLYQPSNKNPLVSMDFKERKDEINKLKPKLNLDNLELLKEVYKKKIINSRLKNELIFYEDMMEERRGYLATLSYNDNPELKDKMLVSSDKIIKTMIELRKAVDDEEIQESQVEGGRKESLSELKLI